MIDRRDFIKIASLAGTSALAGFTPFNTVNKGRVRTFSLCTNTAIINSHPEFLELIAKTTGLIPLRIY